MKNLRLSPEEQALCLALQEAACQQVGGSRGAPRLLPAYLFAVAARNEVASVLGHAPGDIAGGDRSWVEAHSQLFRRVARYMAELDRVAATFAAREIPLVALKNAGIARGIVACPGCCPMGDIDVLVERRAFRQAHQLLLSEGYELNSRSALEEAELDAAVISGGAEYRKVLPGGEILWFELQWRPVAGRWIRPDQEPSAEELIARSIPIAGTAVRLLAPEDNLLQVALHTAKHSYVRAPGFRLHLDVDRVVRLQSIDWDVFLQRVLVLKVKTAVYFSLAIPSVVFNTPIPGDVLARLAPSRWRQQLISRWLHRAGLFNPQERKFGRLGYMLFTSLLYDDLQGFLRAVFPDPNYMRQRYAFKNAALLPYYHGRRLADLAFRRLST